MLKGTQTRKASVNKFVNDKEIRVNRLFTACRTRCATYSLRRKRRFKIPKLRTERFRMSLCVNSNAFQEND